MGQGLREIAGLPATVALLLGAIYAAGAIAHASALARAGASAKDMFAAIPLEQHLDKGIEIIARPYMIANVAFAILLIVSIESLATTPSTRLVRSLRRRLDGHPNRRLISGMTVALLAATVLYFRPIFLGGLAVMLVVSITTFAALLFATYQPTSRSTMPSGVPRLAFVAGVLALTLYSAYVTPEALPNIAISLSTGQIAHGRLITHADGDWYFITSNHSVEAIDDRKVASAFVGAARPYKPLAEETLAQLVED